MNNKRYFIVFYTFVHSGYAPLDGNRAFSTDDGKYVCHEDFSACIKEDDPTIVSVVITGVNELNRVDYEEFIRERK
jgi:hypothetical protein